MQVDLSRFAPSSLGLAHGSPAGEREREGGRTEGGSVFCTMGEDGTMCYRGRERGRGEGGVDREKMN